METQLTIWNNLTCHKGIMDIQRSRIYTCFSLQLLRRTLFAWRPYSVGARTFTEGEQRLIKVLKEKFTGATEVDVQDISGKSYMI